MLDRRTLGPDSPRHSHKIRTRSYGESYEVVGRERRERSLPNRVKHDESVTAYWVRPFMYGKELGSKISLTLPLPVIVKVQATICPTPLPQALPPSCMLSAGP